MEKRAVHRAVNMKSKFIRMLIGRKVDHWLESIPDRPLAERASEHVIVTGGCITSMLLNEKVNDFDMYFDDPQVAYQMAKHYVDRFRANPPSLFRGERKKVEMRVEEPLDGRVRIVVQSAGVVGDGTSGKAKYDYFEGDSDGGEAGAEEYVHAALGNTEALDDHADTDLDDQDGKEEGEKPKYRPRFLTSNAITLTDKVQLVFRFIGDPDEIHSNYDFVHCTNYWHSKDRTLELRPEALEATLARDLRYVGSKYPICSLVRMRKFIKRGWNINAGQILKMAFQVSKLDLTDLAVLEEQLVGVDAAYFNQLIDLLKSKDPAKVDASYLMTIIDRVF